MTRNHINNRQNDALLQSRKFNGLYQYDCPTIAEPSSQVFLLLVAEMTLFMLLIVPLPFAWRLKLYTFISESVWVAKLQYGLKITFIFILILFIDSVNRVYRVQVELAAAKEDTGYVHI